MDHPDFQNEKLGKSLGRAYNEQVPVSAEYTDLVVALKSTIYRGLFKIELLPDSHPLEPGISILVDGSTIAIPKRTLKNAFRSARQVFFNHVEYLELPEQIEEAMLDASVILLLMMPEHLTASNARKRIIMGWEKQSQEKGRKGVIMDLWMINSIFWSPLNKHTKSPTLWSHRKWLIQRLPSLERLQMETICSTLTFICQREVSIIALFAAEIHPRNYYAWGYLRWWIDTNPDLLESFNQCHITESSGYLRPPGLPGLLSTILQWCMTHPGDISGWSFLVWLITKSDANGNGSLCLRETFAVLSRTVLDRTKSLKLRNESTWIFLRTVMSLKDVPQETKDAFTSHAKAIITSNAERPKSRLMAQGALRWVEIYGYKENDD